MTWLIIALIAAGLAVFLYFGLRRHATPRRHGLEAMDLPLEVAIYNRRITLLLPFLRHEVFRELDRHHPRGALLDVGCGPGRLTSDIALRYPDVAVLGLDISAEMLKMARRNTASKGARVAYTVGDVGALPFVNGSLDFAVSTFSLHHWPDAARAFCELRRVLKPGDSREGGHFVLLDLRRDNRRAVYWVLRLGEFLALPRWMRRRDGIYTSALASYTPAELENLIRSAGFSEVSFRHGFGFSLVHAHGSPPPGALESKDEMRRSGLA